MAVHAGAEEKEAERAQRPEHAADAPRATPAQLPPSLVQVLALQRSAGNRATAVLLRQERQTPPAEIPTVSPDESAETSAQEGAQFDDEAIERVKNDEAWDEVRSAVLGVLYGTMQGVTPGGFMMPSPAPENRTFEFFRGAGQIATGVAAMAAGALGEVGGTALDLTVIGAPAGVAINIGSAAVIVHGASSAVAGVGTMANALQMSGRPRESWLPKRGTPERNAIEAARKRGIAQKQAQELADIKGGGRGSGVWTDEELRVIRETGRFPRDVRWHHDPPVALRPDLAGDPSVVRPVRGGHAGHLAAHGGSFIPRNR